MRLAVLSFTDRCQGSPLLDPRPLTQQLCEALAGDALPGEPARAIQQAREGAVEATIAHFRTVLFLRASLERALGQAGLPEALRLERACFADLEPFESIVATADERAIAGIPLAVSAAVALAADIRARVQAEPAALLGLVFALERWIRRLGWPSPVNPFVEASARPARRAASRSKTPRPAGPRRGETVAPASGRGAAVAANPDPAWRALEQRLDSLPEREAAAAIAAALALAHGLARLAEDLGRFDPSALRFSSVSVNPEAGRHALPSDARELLAAFVAGDAAMERIPYLAARFGARGQQFARSDAAWLATLAYLEPTEAQRQLEWLAQVLSPRGMPAWTLEVTLELLYQELVRAVPGRASTYGTLDRVREAMAAQRRAQIPEEEVAALGEGLRRKVPAFSRTFPEVPWLIASAVADERLGRGGAVESLLSWLAAADRFSADWSTALHQAVERLRATAR